MPTLTQRPPATTAATRQKQRAALRWKIALAVLVALLLHAGLILLLAWALPHWPRPPLHRGAEPISLTLQPAEPTPTPGLHPTETVPQQPDYMRTPDDRVSDTPPPDPKFISDKHTQASAEKPPEDLSKPLPSQDGKEISAFDFETNPYIPGKEAHDNLLAAAEPVTAAAPPTPPPVNAQPSPSPTPEPTPTPTPEPGEFLTVRPDPVASNTPPPPTPSAKPASTPPVKDLLAAQAAKVERENRAVSNTALRQPPGYQPQTVQTKMSGSVDSRTGKASVAALGTPLGRYEKAVGDAIGARWYFLIDERMSTLVRTSEVKVHFVVTREGKIIKTSVAGKDPNSALAGVSLEAVANAEVPPIPPDVSSLLPAGQLEGDFVFSFYN